MSHGGDPVIKRVAISPLDTNRFGRRIARVVVDAPSDVEAAVAQAHDLAAAMLIIRVDAVASVTVNAVEEAGGRLCDTLLYYARDVDVGSPPTDVRRALPADAGRIEAVAAAAFAGYLGHYHNDDRLDRVAADAVYRDWARRLVAHDHARGHVLVIESEGQVAGFLVLRVNDREESEIVLNAVDPAFQRRGLYPRLVAAALAECRLLGTTRCLVSTQLVNRAVQRVWVRLGFEPRAASHTFHLWLT